MSSDKIARLVTAHLMGESGRVIGNLTGLSARWMFFQATVPDSKILYRCAMTDASWYDRHLLPYVTDLACGVKPVRTQREKIIPKASGKVLEVGIGTGLNLRHYDRAKVSAITGLDPALQMHRLAAKRIAKAGMNVELIGLSAERIPLDDATFDSIVITYTLCSIPDPVAALKEMRRVLKPEGKLLFCEHGRAPDESVRRWQDRLTPLWKRIGGGCHLNRDIPALLAEGGFSCPHVEMMYLPGPKPLTFNYWGEATP